MLKSILDETSFGEYDFMYLRIGRSSSLSQFTLLTPNRLGQQLQVRLAAFYPLMVPSTDSTSVGYAFINFEDVS